MVTSKARAVLLAAGRGSRLRPITDDRPKCLIGFAGKPLLAHQLDTLARENVLDLTIVTGYRSQDIEAFLDDYEAPQADIRTVRNDDWDQTNMVESLFQARHVFPDQRSGQSLLVAYADLLYETRVLRALLDCRAPVSLTIDESWEGYWEHRMDDPLDDAETLRYDGQTGRLEEIGGSPTSREEIQGQYMGLVKVDPDNVDRFARAYEAMDADQTREGRRFRNMHMTTFIQNLVDDGWHVQACPVKNGWLEFDTVKDLEGYRSLDDRGELDQYISLTEREG